MDEKDVEERIRQVAREEALKLIQAIFGDSSEFSAKFRQGLYHLQLKDLIERNVEPDFERDERG